jgi:F-type H+-transporting ATPase subunit b
MSQTLTPRCRTIWVAGVLLPLSLIIFLSTAGRVLTRADSSSQSSASSSSPQQEQQQKPERHEPSSLAGQLAKESREAAGAGENAAFKQSSSIKWLARITGLSQEHAYWLAVMLNFAVVVVAILWAARRFLPGIFRERTAAIQKAMEEARKASSEARCRLADIEARLSRLDVEIGSMRAAAEKEAQADDARIKAATETDTRKIIESAEQEITAAVKQARRELAAYAADLAVSHAQKQIRVDADTDQALVRGFAEHLSANSSNPPLTKKGSN